MDTESVTGGLNCTSAGTVLAYHAYEAWDLVSNTSEEEEEGWVGGWVGWRRGKVEEGWSGGGMRWRRDGVEEGLG